MIKINLKDQICCVENIDTELGDFIKDQLKKKGWKVSSEYSILMFDKGIDYDSYTLKNGDDHLDFEWDNWYQWKITGPGKLITQIKEEYL